MYKYFFQEIRSNSATYQQIVFPLPDGSPNWRIREFKVVEDSRFEITNPPAYSGAAENSNTTINYKIVVLWECFQEDE